MSCGHKHADEEFTPDDEGLDRVSAAAWFLKGYALPFRVDSSYDIPYVGGISLDGRTVYVDRKAYKAVVAHGVLEGLIEHERVEGILLRAGREYKIAHPIATAAEDRVYKRLGLDPAKAQKVYVPLIRSAADETVTRCPKDLDLHPYSDPPTDYKHLALVKEAQG